MSNDLVSLEQVQAQAITLDTQRQLAMDNVTLFVNKVEENLRSAIAELKEMIPNINKAVEELKKKYNGLHEASCESAKNDVVEEYEDLLVPLKKRGFKNVDIKVLEHGDDKDNHVFHVSITQTNSENRYSSDDIWLGTSSNRSPELRPISKNALAAKAELCAMTDKLTEAQKRLLDLTIEVQDIGRHEREGKALVIKAERKRTKEGAAMVSMVETAAAEKCDGISQYLADLGKSLKSLPGKK